MRICGVFLVAIGLLVAGMGSSHGACQCACVDGQVRPICENAIDLKPICAPQVCQLVPPSVRPIQAPIVPPIGTKSCQPQQVFNSASRTYEWRTLCH